MPSPVVVLRLSRIQHGLLECSGVLDIGRETTLPLDLANSLLVAPLFSQFASVFHGLPLPRIDRPELGRRVRLPDPDIAIVRSGQNEIGCGGVDRVEYPLHSFCVVRVP